MASPDLGKLFDNRPAGSTDLLAIAVAAKLLGGSTSSMRRLGREWRIPFDKAGRFVVLATDEVAAYFAKRRVETAG